MCVIKLIRCVETFSSARVNEMYGMAEVRMQKSMEWNLWQDKSWESREKAARTPIRLQRTPHGVTERQTYELSHGGQVLPEINECQNKFIFIRVLLHLPVILELDQAAFHIFCRAEISANKFWYTSNKG